MNRSSSIFLFFLFAVSLFAGNPPLKGFHYGPSQTPTGKEWESPENLALNKEQPHAWFFSFPDRKSARKVLPEYSSYWKSLDGKWKFNWAPDPDSRPKNFYARDYDVTSWDEISVPSNWNIVGIQKDGNLKYGLPIYVNQRVIFQHSVKVDDWRGGVMRTPPKTWTTYKHRNEVGSYRRDFNLPASWSNRETYINFDGVDSFFYLWINGKYVGFSKNSRNTASFNISKYLRKGSNTVSVEVYRNSDGSFLESQDMFRLPGIFRTVSLHSKPKIAIQNLIVKPDLDNNYANGSLLIKTNIRNSTNKSAHNYKLVFSLYENKLYSDENVLLKNSIVKLPIGEIGKNSLLEDQSIVMKIPSPKKWSAESPHRYTLIAELKDSKNRTVETVSTITGFVKVEIKDTPASDDEFGLSGRYFYVNGKPIKLKGVNRHESHPALGHAITHKIMEEDVMMMKRANINHVRNSHYSMNPYWYFLCNKYGIYLEDEANIESHEYYYGKESLSHPVEWRDAHVARVTEMVCSNINNPSIIIWSLGNEAGPGKNFKFAYEAVKSLDQRPVQYERNNQIVDIGSNQYPSIAWVRGAVKGKYDIKYPFHISEYAHSMGNAVGNLIDYWEAIESSNFIMGGAIWDWVDQSLYNYDKKSGDRYLAYGGDFGDFPNDGQFVMNGIIFADREPKPQYYEVKKVYQNIGIKGIDIQHGKLEIFNKNYFKDLSDYDVEWALSEDGRVVKKGNVSLTPTAPRHKSMLSVPFGYDMKIDSEYFLIVRFKLKSDRPWGKKGFVQAEEQFLVKSPENRPAMINVANGSSALEAKTIGKKIIVGNNEFEADFDLEKGTISGLKYGNDTVIKDGNGPKVDAFRAFVNNDNWAFKQWFENGLHNLKQKVVNSNVVKEKNGTVIVAFTIESQAPHGAKINGGTSLAHNVIEEQVDKPFGPNDFKITTSQLWTIYRDGSIELRSCFTSNKGGFVLPRLGYLVKLPKQYSKFTYYGRGPVENYPDRKTAQCIAQYESNPKNEFINYPKPQDMANHEDVRWCAMTNESGKGIVFISSDSMSVSAIPYSDQDLIGAPHPYQLPKSSGTFLHLSLGVTGLGGNSCGQGAPLPKDRVKAGYHVMNFIIRPARPNLTAVAKVVPSGKSPLAIIRNQIGKVAIKSPRKNAVIKYRINDSKKIYDYIAPFDFFDEGTVEAWTADNPYLRNKCSFKKVNAIKPEVIFASSEEVGEGNAANLTDGNPNTVWHTMYSVTVAKYPHWVDLDMKKKYIIKGFVYLPRQGRGDGTIKDYSLQVSDDGKNWTPPIVKGQFKKGDQAKKVIFSKPVNARYVRFTGLSEQNGKDYASGAELTILFN